ncbi:VOC family protein [Yoonia sediminilitoris]|uniref:Glyoxalase family protein n=1 Tax=Yoonia sediminilitoris TaxID=1286148 RepID=A0A2T6KA35_9RHOB|nr:VOC family protein [Yoonia sediminilitoris]PUB11609.1 glyoxalase family protein [Yoonia sediminilitoris]RCW91809.1 glyoxalase family protein [Yoonia sediminilitoris]
MLTQIKGLHHVTSLASDARMNNAFFTNVLGLRRVKKTVNFDAPDVYHLYYGDETGTPGTVMTYFPFPHAARGRQGVGEVGRTVFSIPTGAARMWVDRLSTFEVANISTSNKFGETRVLFDGPDGDGFALVESDDNRTPWTGAGVSEEMGIRGFHSTDMRLKNAGASAELLQFMGYERQDTDGNVTRFIVPGGNDANTIDLEELPDAPFATQGAGSVHHIAFAVENRARQLEVREALLDTGYQVTPVIDRDYFYAIYFRTPGGVLFEVATNEPGFDRDEDTAHLGEALKLPSQHEHLRAKLEGYLAPLED